MAALKNRLIYLISEKQKRDNRLITLTELATETSLSYNTLRRWTNNDVERFDSPVVVALCDYFGCDIADLLYIERAKA